MLSDTKKNMFTAAKALLKVDDVPSSTRVYAIAIKVVAVACFFFTIL